MSPTGSFRQLHETISIRSRGRGFIDITDACAAVVTRSAVESGACTLLLQHTSASLLVQENADPAVQRDLAAFLAKLCPEGRDLYEQDAEGPDDMPAHLRASLLPVTLTLPVLDARLRLGTWQALYLVEHRAAPQSRRIAVHVFGEAAP